MNLINLAKYFCVACILMALTGCFGDSPTGAIGVSSGASGGSSDVDTTVLQEDFSSTSWETNCFLDSFTHRVDPRGAAYLKYQIKFNGDADRITLQHRVWEDSNSSCAGAEEQVFEARYKVTDIVSYTTSSGLPAYSILLELSQEQNPNSWFESKYISVALDKDSEIVYIYDPDGIDITIDFDRPYFKE